MSDYPDPWGPGGKFIDSGLHRVDDMEGDGCAPDCPHRNGTDDVPCFYRPSFEGNREAP